MLRQKSYFNNIYHVINIGVGDMDIFRNDDDKDYFCELMQKNTKKHSITMYSYAIMDNHFHFCLSSPNFANISNFMRDISAPYARYFNRTEITIKNNKPTKRHGAVFAEAFKAIPVNSTHQLIALVRYIHNNPDSANQDVKTYRYSSLRKYLQLLFKKTTESDPVWEIDLDVSYFKDYSQAEFTDIMKRNDEDEFCEGDSKLKGRNYMSDSILRDELKNAFSLNPADLRNMSKTKQAEWLFTISLIPGTYVKQLSRIIGLPYNYIRNCINDFKEKIESESRLAKLKKKVINTLTGFNNPPLGNAIV